jgi:hypothetical protein
MQVVTDGETLAQCTLDVHIVPSLGVLGEEGASIKGVTDPCTRVISWNATEKISVVSEVATRIIPLDR